MNWKSAQLLLASTVTIAFAAQVIKKFYNKYVSKTKAANTSGPVSETCDDVVNTKNREINDVIVFADDIVRHTIQVSPNKDVTICEKRGQNCFKLIKYIKSAKKTLDICMYLITSSEIADHIIKLGQKHVLVRIIVDDDMAYTPPSQVKRLQEYSFIQVQTTNKPILIHHKFCIVDGPAAIKRKYMLRSYAEKINVHAFDAQKHKKYQHKQKPCIGFVMSGSLNWSTQAMLANRESVIVTSNKNILNKFQEEFECLWQENEPALKSEHFTN